MMTEILSAIEGLAPEAVTQIEAYVKAREAELKATLEEHYGVKPSVVSDAAPESAPAPKTEEAAVPGVQPDVSSFPVPEGMNPAQASYYRRAMQAMQTRGQAPQDATPTALATDYMAPAASAAPVSTDATVQALLQRMASLEAQLAEEKARRDNPETISSGSGEPVPHNLFLDDGTVIKNHGGIATSYSTTNPDGTESVRKVVAAYPA
jgi:hypothetical protein